MSNGKIKKNSLHLLFFFTFSLTNGQSTPYPLRKKQENIDMKHQLLQKKIE